MSGGMARHSANLTSASDGNVFRILAVSVELGQAECLRQSQRHFVQAQRPMKNKMPTPPPCGLNGARDLGLKEGKREVSPPSHPTRL